MRGSKKRSDFISPQNGCNESARIAMSLRALAAAPASFMRKIDMKTEGDLGVKAKQVDGKAKGGGRKCRPTPQT